MERLASSVVVPVVVLERVEDALPTAQALLAGGVDTMEITFRTPCAADAIRAVAEHCPEMLVGAGTVLNVAQAKLAVTPGCVTPTEIMMAVNRGLKVVKFFPANVYGGLNAMKNLSAPFVGIKFLPTGGVNTGNIKEYVDAPFVHAVGGSWVCTKADIAAGQWEKITLLCQEARKAAKGE